MPTIFIELDRALRRSPANLLTPKRIPRELIEETEQQPRFLPRRRRSRRLRIPIGFFLLV
jgi:hypothetical protein